jgi:hypothetical protein
MTPIDAFTWPLERLGEGIEELARRTGLCRASEENLVPPSSIASGHGTDLGRWIEWAGARLGHRGRIGRDHLRRDRRAHSRRRPRGDRPAWQPGASFPAGDAAGPSPGASARPGSGGAQLPVGPDPRRGLRRPGSPAGQGDRSAARARAGSGPQSGARAPLDGRRTPGGPSGGRMLGAAPCAGREFSRPADPGAPAAAGVGHARPVRRGVSARNPGLGPDGRRRPERPARHGLAGRLGPAAGHAGAAAFAGRMAGRHVRAGCRPRAQEAPAGRRAEPGHRSGQASGCGPPAGAGDGEPGARIARPERRPDRAGGGSGAGLCGLDPGDRRGRQDCT